MQTVLFRTAQDDGVQLSTPCPSDAACNMVPASFHSIFSLIEVLKQQISKLCKGEAATMMILGKFDERSYSPFSCHNDRDLLRSQPTTPDVCVQLPGHCHFPRPTNCSGLAFARARSRVAITWARFLGSFSHVARPCGRTGCRSRGF